MRRVRSNPPSHISPPPADEAEGVGKLVAEFRNTKWYKRGEQIIQRVRRGYSGGGSNVAARGYSAGRMVERVVESIPKYARKISGSLGPPDVRKASERKLVGRRP